MKAFFAHTVSTVNRVNGEVTISWFYVNSGTGQGDIQGPPIFKICLNFSAYLTELNKVISKGALLQLPAHPRMVNTIIESQSCLHLVMKL